MSRPLALVFLLACLAMPGCIVEEIRDEIGTSNERLEAINRTIEQIERTNTLLTNVEKSLTSIDTRLESIDQNLGSVDTRLTALQVILDAVSEHLASLRKTINNIDSTIPFLKFSGDDEEDKEALEAGQTEPEAAPTELQPQTPPSETPQPAAGSGP
ncbi:hypothetical protein [Nodularia spumigena]|uniref:hypothetical protein n=1 Tax=Nodularia spumigena TaxID=70799 RepID=UPI002B209D76|nr:hypothetical protein [Nodularia spumigena]MEA5615403.1 hypothetical protein [Nodularia spumigena UHCC 0040]